VKKFLLVVLFILLIPVALVLVALATGTIHTSSIRMVLNVAGVAGVNTSADLVEQRLTAPQGFSLRLYVSLRLYASGLERARFMRITSAGDLLVSRPHSGDIQLLERDADDDGRADSVRTIIADLNRPHGVDFLGDWLYIAESNRIGRIRFDATAGETVGEYEVVVDGLTDNGNHWTKTLRVGSDGLLYLTQGSTCNGV